MIKPIEVAGNIDNFWILDRLEICALCFSLTNFIMIKADV